MVMIRMNGAKGTQYGWQEGTLPDDTMLPVSQWDPKDRSELQNMLHIAQGDYGNDPYERRQGRAR
jgi:hypothetical protein